MKKIMLLSACCLLLATLPATAYQLKSSKELGAGDAKNQNIVVACTTATGTVSSQTCSLRRYAKCTVNSSGTKNCSGWEQWKDIRNPSKGYGDWRSAAAACCRARGLR